MHLKTQTKGWGLTIMVGMVALVPLAPRSARAQVHDPLHYHGGPVMGTMTIYPLYYGAWTTAEINANQNYLTGLAAYMSGVNAPLNKQPMMKQYGSISVNVAAAVTSGPSVPLTTPTMVTRADILNIIHTAQAAFVASHRLPAYAANRLLMVFPAHLYSNAECMGCGYHGSESTTAFFASVPADVGPSLPLVAAHEVFEAMASPAFDQQPGWDEAVDGCTGESLVHMSFGDIPGAADNSNSGTCSTTGYTPTLSGNLAAIGVADTTGSAVGPAGMAEIITSNKGPANADGLSINSGYINVLTSTGSAFTYANWASIPFYGSHGTFFADVTGNDGKADAIAVGDNYIGVLRSNGSSFGAFETWKSNFPFYGSKGTFIVDVTGDGRADAVAVGDNYIGVLRSTGSSFGAYENWKVNFPFFGSHGTFFADVTGDGKADAIAVGDDFIAVMRSDGSSFGAYERWATFPFYGSKGTFFADVDGDGKADAVAVGDNYIGVLRSTGSSFGGFETWKQNFPFYGSRGTFIADVDGDGKADAIAAGDNYVGVLRSTGSSFGGYENWYTSGF